MSDRDEPLPRGWSYKTKRFKPTPEQEAKVRRWIEQQDAVLKERLRKLYGPKD
jgi:hypothetical protein